MKRYKAYATISYDLVCEFDVEEGQDAWDVARDLDGGVFKEVDNTSEWNLYEIQEVENV